MLTMSATAPPIVAQDANIAQINRQKLAVQAKATGLSHQKMQRVVSAARFGLDMATTYGVGVLAYVLHFYFGPGQEEVRTPELLANYQLVILGITGLLVFYAWMQGLYRGALGTRVEETVRVMRTTGLTLLTLFTVLFFIREASYSRGFMFLMAVGIPFGVGGARMLLSTWVNHLHAKGYGNRRVIFVGSGNHARFVYGRLLRHPEAGYTAVGYLRSDGADDLKGLLPRLGTVGSLRHAVTEHAADEVIVALPASQHAECAPVIQQAMQLGVAVRLLPEVYQFIPDPVSFEAIRGVYVLSPRATALAGFNAMAKRAVDITLASVLMLTLAPVFAVIGFLIWLEDRGPVIYSQERVGLNGRPFRIHKFRSMTVNAEEATGPVWAREDDPRTTRVGKWLRHLSLDELPQFINVLKGEMSFIGPRPERRAFVDQFAAVIRRYEERHHVRPGISGWAQVNGLRGNTSIEERTRYDLFYKDSWSWTLELRIYLQTFLELILRRNAY